MIVILKEPYTIGKKTHPKGTGIDFESNTAKRMIRSGKAKKPGVIYRAKQRIEKTKKAIKKRTKKETKN